LICYSVSDTFRDAKQLKGQSATSCNVETPNKQPEFRPKLKTPAKAAPAAPSEKEAPKGPSAKELAAEKAKAEKAAREVIIEAAAKEIEESLSAVRESEEQVNNGLWDAVDKATAAQNANKFDRAELRSSIVLALSGAYDEKRDNIVRSAVAGSQAAYLYNLSSKITTLASAQNDKNFSKLIAKMRQKGEGFNSVLSQVSKPKSDKKTDGEGEGEGKVKGGKKEKLALPEVVDVITAFKSVVERAKASGHDADVISEAFAEAMAQHEVEAENDENIKTN
jgi:hypothetical protein